MLALWAASVPHCCAGIPGAVAARDVPAKSFYPCRNKGSFCLLPGAQLSHTAGCNRSLQSRVWPPCFCGHIILP